MNRDDLNLINRVYDLLDGLNDVSRDHWMAPWMVWLLLGSLLPIGPVPSGGLILLGVFLYWADPTTRLFGRKPEKPEDEQ